MKKIARSIPVVPILILLSLFIPSVPVLAQGIDSSTPRTVVLTDGQGEYPLGLYLQILKDPGGKLTIEDVSSPEYEAQFIASRTAVPNFGFTDDTSWVRFRVKNDSSKLDHWLLELGFANMHYADLYLPGPDGTSWIAKQTGILRPFHTRDIANRHILFELPLPVHEERTFYMRFQSGASMTLPLTLWLPEAFFQSYGAELLFLGLFYGALLIMLVYHLFVLYSLRQASNLYYVCFLAGAILAFACYDAFAAQYLWPNLFEMNRFALPVFLIVVFVSILMFTDSFLETGKRNPKLHRLFLLLAAGYGFILLLMPFISYELLATLLVPYILLSLAVTFIAGLISWQSGYKPARFFLFAWLGLLIGLTLNFLVREGITSSTNFNENLERFGILWLAAFWSISLTDRVNLLQSEMERAHRALQNSEHQLSQILEGLPLAVVMYQKDRKPGYGNQRTYEILSNPDRGIRPDISAGRTLEMAIDYYSLKKAGTDQPYPLEHFPVQSALNGVSATADDIEADLGNRRIPLEMWASPIKDEAGNVESAVVAFQDISLRRQAEAELIVYRHLLETLVQERTTDLNSLNEKLEQRLGWLSAVNKIHDSITGTASLAGVYAELSERILHIFHARLVFIMRWNSPETQPETMSCSLASGKAHDNKALQALFQEGSTLRREIEQGKILTCPPDLTAAFSTSFSECFPGQEVPVLLLAPMMIGQSVIGVLGMAVTPASGNLIQEESDLVERMALDLASLSQGAILLDQAVLLATVEERNRLARELHDSVTQTLFTASVLAEATPRIWDRDQGIARQNFSKLSRLIRGALAEMRSMLIELRMGDLHRQTLAQLLITLVDGAQARSQAFMTLSLPEDLPRLPEKIIICFYRVAREAINNATVHSGAAQIMVTLAEESGQMALRIQDDGCGFEPELVSAGHLGISIIGERAQEIGATLLIQSEPGQGTTVSIAWPDQSAEREGHE